MVKNNKTTTSSSKTITTMNREGEINEEFSKKSTIHNGENPTYHGVRKRSWGKWVSEIREPRKKSRIWLGSFDNPEMAARAHDVAAIAIKGRSAILNFPQLAHLLPKPASTSPSDIQAAAIQAASLAINEICSRNHDFKSQAELEPEVGNLTSLDDTFLDLPDLFIDLGNRMDRLLYTLPEYIAGAETGDNELWAEEHFLWHNC